MRKISLILVVLLLTVPTWASVDINCSRVGDTNEILVSYKVNSEPNKVRAFSLDISVDKGARITDVNDNVSLFYYIYPGSIQISGNNVTDWGTAVADPCYPGTLPGLGTSGVTVEMGALYSPTNDSSPNAPPLLGNLLKLTVGGVTNGCKVSIIENEARGGVVLTNPTLSPDVNSLGYTFQLGITDCFPSTYTTYKDWVALGKPNCWCAKPIGSGYQCDGDVDGATETFSKYRVYMNDLNRLVASWKKKLGEVGLDSCADIDHKSETFSKYRVYMADLNKLVANWKKKDTDVAYLPGNCPRVE